MQTRSAEKREGNQSHPGSYSFAQGAAHCKFTHSPRKRSHTHTHTQAAALMRKQHQHRRPHATRGTSAYRLGQHRRTVRSLRLTSSSSVAWAPMQSWQTRSRRALLGDGRTPWPPKQSGGAEHLPRRQHLVADVHHPPERPMVPGTAVVKRMP